MKNWLSHFIIQITSHYFFCIIIITFFESLAIIGLLTPSLIFMTTIGILIGKGKISLFFSWIAGSIGCLSGDCISYYLGKKFKKWIYTVHIFNNNIFIFKKIKKILNQYNIITILIGKFIGPIRPLIPLISGMLNISIKNFLFPSIIGCIIWPILYFLPGIITGKYINKPNIYNKINILENILIFTIIFIIITLIIYKTNKIKDIIKKILFFHK